MVNVIVHLYGGSVHTVDVIMSEKSAAERVIANLGDGYPGISDDGNRVGYAEKLYDAQHAELSIRDLDEEIRWLQTEVIP